MGIDVTGWSAGKCYHYALDAVNGRFHDGEVEIARDARWSCEYAITVLKGRFPAGEAAIANNAQYSYHYALDAVNGRFLDGEVEIARDARWSYFYARDVVKDRFPNGEAVIRASKYFRNSYRDLMVELGIFGDKELVLWELMG